MRRVARKRHLGSAAQHERRHSARIVTRNARKNGTIGERIEYDERLEKKMKIK